MLNELQEIVKRIDALLNDPHPGLFTWNEALSIELAKLHKWMVEAKVC